MRYPSKEKREDGNHGNAISQAVVRKIISEHRKQCLCFSVFYKIRCYDCIKSNETVDKENTSSKPKKMDKKVLIHLCSAHVMKSFTNRFAKLTTDKKV